ncbi:MAG: SAM-dependent methyltransferase [Arcobacteraceae bacterium]|nr:SAM-dependent methyltransferase [Arcobacteraceae bacterium]
MIGTVTFSQYFNDWLYSKDGYYSNYKTIGKEGDFYTAVSSSSFFGGTIGKRVVDIINDGFLSEEATIIEIGAHHGYLLSDMIQFIFTLNPELIKTLKFAIVERYEHLRIKQQEYFKQCFGDEIELIHYNDISEVNEKEAFVVANEIFDAFACDLVYTNDKNTLQYAVVENDTIKFIDNDDTFLAQYCEKYKVTKGEVARGYEEFASNLCNNIKKFEFVTFDYGEKYPRNDFSCRIYENHNVYPIFDENIKLENLYKQSDITYDVNFTHVIDSFKKAGAVNLSYETQLKALVSFGIIELLEILHKNVDEDTYLKEANKVKTLLNPIGMGDRFKMVSFRKGK